MPGMTGIQTGFLQHQASADAVGRFLAFQEFHEGHAVNVGLAILGVLKGEETVQRVKAGLML